ncbi:MAG: hypothetical protein IPP01_13740 [Saprospiraceae bacterium]|nr:hypothetical protein [Saprospiraceae bacterium]
MIKYLEFIQNIVSRLNSNSFQIKGLSITILSALLAVYSSNNNLKILILAIIPTFLLWLLDSYYLYQERLFRDLFKKISNIESNKNEFKHFDLSISDIEKKTDKYLSAVFSKTTFIFYYSIILVLIITYVILK